MTSVPLYHKGQVWPLSEKKNDVLGKIITNLDIPSVVDFLFTTKLVYSLSCEIGLLQVDFYCHKVLCFDERGSKA